MMIHCPHCGVKGTVDDAYLHKKIRCPRCQEIFRAEVEDGTGAVPGGAGPERPETVTTAASPAEDGAQAVSAESQPLTEEEVRAGLDNLFEKKLICSSCARQADENEEFQASGQGLLCPDCAARQATASAGEAVPPPPPPEPVRPEPVWRRENGAQAAGGSGDRALPLDFTIEQALREAWRLTDGAKGEIWKACAVLIVFSLAVGGMAHQMLAEDGSAGFLGNVFDLISSIISSLLTAGLLFLGVQRANSRDIGWRTVFTGFSSQFTPQLIAVFVLQFLLVSLGFLLLILPGIYLSVGYSLSLPLVIDRKMSPWQALEESRKAIHPIWWKIFALYLIIGILLFASFLFFGIGLIWTVPFSVILGGVVYRALFGNSQRVQ